MRTASFALCFLALSASAAAARDCYAPTPEETARYQAIAKRLAGEATPGALNSVSQQEVQWALQLEQRVNSNGYQPTEQEMAAYYNIAERLGGSQAPAPSSAAPRAEDSARDSTAWSAPARTPAPPRVSEQDMDWAQDLVARLKRGETPSREERRRYEDVYWRVEASRAAGPPPPPTRRPEPRAPASVPAPVSEQDITWALDLEARVKRGENPTAEETSRYEDVARRLAASQAADQAQPPARQPDPREPGSAPVPVSEQDITWALDLEARVKRGEIPTAEETSRYEDVARRLAASQAADQAQPPARPPEPRQPPQGLAPVGEDEMTWAIALQTLVQDGYQATEAEIERYDDIYRRYQAAMSPPAQTPPMPPAVYPQPYPPPPQPTWTVFGANEADIQWALDLERKVNGPCPAP